MIIIIIPDVSRLLHEKYEGLYIAKINRVLIWIINCIRFKKIIGTIHRTSDTSKPEYRFVLFYRIETTSYFKEYWIEVIAFKFYDIPVKLPQMLTFISQVFEFPPTTTGAAVLKKTAKYLDLSLFFQHISQTKRILTTAVN